MKVEGLDVAAAIETLSEQRCNRIEGRIGHRSRESLEELNAGLGSGDRVRPQVGGGYG